MKQLTIILLIGLLFSGKEAVVFAEDSTVITQEENDEESSLEGKEKELAREASSFADFFREQAKNAFKGVVFGNIIALEDNYLYVKPHEDGLGRMYVYLDRNTLYSKMDKGKRERSRKSKLLEGQRVAIRVLMKEGIILADEVFLVEGEFESRSRYRKKVFSKRKKSGEDDGGGHGAKKEADHGAKEEKPKSKGH